MRKKERYEQDQRSKPAAELEEQERERRDMRECAKMIRDAARIEKRAKDAERIFRLRVGFRRDLLCAMLRNDMIHKNATTHSRKQTFELVNNLTEFILTGEVT